MEEIIIGAGLLDSAGRLAAERIKPGKAAIISDRHVAPLYADRLRRSLELAGFRVFCHHIVPGEASKNLGNYGDILAFLADSGLTRPDTVFALGGGVVGDIAGFAAATYLRGVGLVQMPTTLLACVDSAIGGKTAVDLPQGKNLAGAFYPPILVLMDPRLLRSLPEAEYRSGLAELVKTAVIRDRALFDSIPYDEGEEEALIRRCVEIKTEVVSQDGRDQGLRQLLNFGHSFGHAIEALSGYSLSHGEAVSIGMALIARASTAMGLCPKDDSGRLIGMLRLLGLPTHTDYAEAEIARYLLADKKRSGDQIGLIMMHAIGDCRLQSYNLDEAREILRLGLAR